MPSTDRPFSARLETGWRRATAYPELALVPVLSSLLSPDNVRRALEVRGTHFGVAFPFPPALPDLWTFVSLPSQGPGINVSPTLPLVPVLILVQTALVAGLVGSVHEILETGEYDFAQNAKRYFVRVLLFEVLVWTLVLATFAVGVAASPLLLLAIPAFFVLSYLFYATPYLLVVADLNLGDALARSYEWAVAGGSYLSFAFGFLLFAAAVSIVATAVVVNLGAVGILVGTVVSAPVALALTFATTEFVVDMATQKRGDDRDGFDSTDSTDSSGWD